MCGLEEWVLPLTVRDLVRLVGQVGSHREYEHPVKPARVDDLGEAEQRRASEEGTEDP